MSQTKRIENEDSWSHLSGLLAATSLTPKARTRIQRVVMRAASLEWLIRANDEVRTTYSGDQSHDARKMREASREAVESGARRMRIAVRDLVTYVDDRGPRLIAGIDALAALGKSDEQRACEAIAEGLAALLERSKCARCDWRDAPCGSHAALCSDCAHVIGEWLNRMGLGMLPHVANRVAPLLRSVDADGVPGCACGDPECSQCGTPQAADVLQHNRCATAGAVTVAEYERGDLTDDERDAFTL